MSAPVIQMYKLIEPADALTIPPCPKGYDYGRHLSPVADTGCDCGRRRNLLRSTAALIAGLIVVPAFGSTHPGQRIKPERPRQARIITTPKKPRARPTPTTSRRVR